MVIEQSSYIREWKAHMHQVIRYKYTEDQLSDKAIEKYLDSKIKENLNDRGVVLVNNYTSKVFRMSILDLIEVIRENQLITAGGGCLYVPHSKKRNVLIEFILFVMEGRKKAKAKRKQFDKGTTEWEEADREQLSYKLLINSLYGCMGYPGFLMFNIFNAEAITNQGKHIITSAINAIENFLGDAMAFEVESEIFTYINRIHNEMISVGGKFSDKLLNDFKSQMQFDLDELPNKCVDRIVSHCIFPVSESLINTLRNIYNGMTTDELLMQYFKNNFMEFNRLDFIKKLIRDLIVHNGALNFCEDWCYKDDHSRAIVDEIWNFYKLFVLYDYPINDRIRKAMYLDKHRSLYTDTDSVFVSLAEFVSYIISEVFDDWKDSGLDYNNLIFTAANIALTFDCRMIDRTCKTLCNSLNIAPDFGKLLVLKNEFFFKRIMFTDVKKRYVSLALLQEGQTLSKDGKEGYPEIKGFDFKKSGTKKKVRDYYTDLCMEDILRSDNIIPVKILKKVLDLKAEMESEIKNGSMEYFKQANVKKPEFYKNPYSTQGVTSILLWNALMPDKEIEFPSDVNIVPIKCLTFTKDTHYLSDGKVVIKGKTKGTSANMQWYYETYPEAYMRLHQTIYMNNNPLIRHMGLNSIAIPKNLDYELPDFITGLLDYTSIINNNISLILPILKCLGINSFKPNSTTEYVSNMIQI